MIANFKSITLFCLLAVQMFLAQKVNVSASESDAQLFVNGKPAGTGSYILKIEKDQCYNVRAVKQGFLKYDASVCGKKAGPHAVSNFSFGIWQYFGGLSVTGRPLFSLSKAVS